MLDSLSKLEKSKYVNKIFSNVSKSYDLMNDIMSFGGNTTTIRSVQPSLSSTTPASKTRKKKTRRNAFGFLTFANATAFVAKLCPTFASYAASKPMFIRGQRARQ